MGALLEKLGSHAPRPVPAPEPADVRFVPAHWLVVAPAVLRLFFRGSKVGKLGIVGLVWSVAPRTLKIVAASLALAATVVLIGAVAAITLLALQLA